MTFSFDITSLTIVDSFLRHLSYHLSHILIFGEAFDLSRLTCLLLLPRPRTSLLLRL